MVEADARLPSAADAALAAVSLEDVDAGHVRRANQRGPLLFAVSHLLLRHDGKDLRDRAAGGPFLFAVEDVVLAVGRQFAARLLSTSIAADIGLGEAERAEPLACQMRQPAGF